MLSKVSETAKQADWSRHLLDIEFAMNNTNSSTTKQTPSKLLFGTNQRGTKIDHLTEYLTEKTDETTDRTDLNKIRQSSLESIEKSQRYNENYFFGEKPTGR